MKRVLFWIGDKAYGVEFDHTGQAFGVVVGFRQLVFIAGRYCLRLGHIKQLGWRDKGKRVSRETMG